MMLLTLRDAWLDIWVPITEYVANSETLAAIGGLVSTVVVPTAVLVYYKVVAPRLAKAKFINKQYDEFVTLAKKMDEKMDSTLGFNLNLKEDLIFLREIMGLAFTNSNLDGHTKELIKTVLKGISTGERINATKELEDISDSAKQFIKESSEAVKLIVEEKKSSALASLAAEVKLIEAAEAIKEQEASVEVVNQEG